MPAYRDALVIDADSPAERLSLAAQLLRDREGVVLLDGVIALRPTRRELICEVVDLEPSAHRCAFEYEVLVENARRALEASRLHDLLPELPRAWLVVEDTGAGTVEVWRPS
jgi:hypothetical protein